MREVDDGCDDRLVGERPADAGDEAAVDLDGRDGELDAGTTATSSPCRSRRARSRIRAGATWSAPRRRVGRSSSSVDSVTSKPRLRDVIAPSSSARCTIAHRSTPSTSCSVARLTHTRIGRPLPRRAPPRTRATSPRRAPIRRASTIRPSRSASGRNSSGREQPEVGVLPAHERLDADDLAVAEIDLRLDVQAQLVALEGAPELVGRCGLPRGGRTDDADRAPLGTSTVAWPRNHRQIVNGPLKDSSAPQSQRVSTEARFRTVLLHATATHGVRCQRSMQRQGCRRASLPRVQRMAR